MKTLKVSNSMNIIKKRFKKAFILFIIINVIFNFKRAEAQNDTTQAKNQEFNIDGIEVIGQRAPALYSELSRQIVVIDREEIAKAPVQNVNDIIQYATNIDLRQRGNSDVQADLSIRGGTFDQSLVLLNGVNISDPQTGHHNLDLPISISQIDHIEILAGPGSRVFGPNAYSGAINIVTKTAKNNSMDISSYAGEHGLFHTGLSVNNYNKKIQNYFSINNTQSNGYAGNTDFKHFNIYYQGVLKSKKYDINWQMSYSDKAFGANSFYTAKFPNQYEKTKAGFGSVKFHKKGKIDIKTIIFWRGHTDHFELFRDNVNAPDWYKSPNYHFTSIFGINNNIYKISKLGKTSIGIDLRKESILSNVLGIAMEDTITGLFEKNDFYTKKDKRYNSSVYFEHAIFLNRFNAAAGVMININSLWPGKIYFYPGIDASYKLNSNLKVYATINTAMRVPTFTDLYYQGPTNIGNPNLKAEKSVNYETGVKYQKSWGKGNISIFFNDGKNTIDWIRKTSSDKWQPQNITNIRTVGFEAGFVFYPQYLLEKQTFVEQISLSFGHIYKTKSSDEFQSCYALDYLHNKILFNIEHKIYKNLIASWNLRFQDRNGYYLIYDAQQANDIQKSYKPYTLLDCKILWQHKNLNIFLQANNIFDVRYFDFGNIIQPGRWMSAGFHWHIPLRQKI